MRKMFLLSSAAVIVAVFISSAFAQESGRHEALGGEGAFFNFLGQHPEMKSELEANPDRINNPEYVKQHPELQSFYKEHPEVQKEMQENAPDFMRHEKMQMAYHQGFNNFHDYLKGHPEVEDQLKNNPQLADDPNFLKQHPNLHEYLKTHPEVAYQMRHDPKWFESSETRSLEESNPKKAPAETAPGGAATPIKRHQHEPKNAPHA